MDAKMEDQPPKVIAKVTNDDELKAVCQEVSGLKPPVDPVKGNELLHKIEVYLNTMMSKWVNPDEEDSKAPTDKRVYEFLLLLEKELPWKLYMHSNGSDLYSHLFKLTHYGPGILYSVKNGDNLVDDFSQLESSLEECPNIKSKINFMINNLIDKLLFRAKEKF